MAQTKERNCVRYYCYCRCCYYYCDCADADYLGYCRLRKREKGPEEEAEENMRQIKARVEGLAKKMRK